MQDILNLILDELRGTWRYRWYALGVAWGVALAGWLYVLLLPDKYEASARVFVDPSTALKPVIQGLAVEQDVNAELNLVRQSLLSEPNLRKVVAQVGLGIPTATPEQKSDAISSLRDRIEVTVLSSAPPGMDPGNSNPSKIYLIKYQDSSRDRSLRVVDILLNNFMEGTLGGKREGSATAQKFLQDQIKDYEVRLAASEERLAGFKKRNVGMVPGEQGDYFTRLQNEMDAEKKTQTTLSAALTRRDALQRQLRGEASIAASTGTVSGMMPNGTTLPGGGGDTLSNIRENQAKLDELLLRYTDKHPDVVSVRETLERLKARRAAELDGLKKGDPNAAALTGASSNPVYQSIQLAINQAEVEIAGLRGELGDHQRKVVELRNMVDTMPQVEAEFQRLNRDYQVTKGQYTALAERLEKARVGEEADATGSVRFEVIDPPNAPFQPVFPQRQLFLTFVLGGAIGLGLGVAYLFNLLRPVFNSAQRLGAATGLTVLGSVSLTRSEQEASSLRLGYLKYSAVAASLIAMFFIVVVVGMQYAPLSLKFSGS